MALNVWQKKNKRIDHHLQVPNRIIQIADDIPLKLLNGIVRFCEAQFLHLHFHGQAPRRHAPMQLLLLLVDLPEKWAPLYFAKMGIVA